MDWVYKQIIGFLANFFAEMGNMGAEMFEMSWVQSIVLFFSYLAWILYAVGFVVACAECGLEYVEWIKPRLAKVIQRAKEIKPDIIVFYHSCGYVEPLIPHLIEAGIDVLNPVQPECMDFEEIFKKYGDKVAFHGTIGTQSTMPFGTPEDVKAAVKRNLDIAGPKGGLLVAPTHLLEPEVPLDNVVAYVEACRDNHF